MWGRVRGWVALDRLWWVQLAKVGVAAALSWSVAKILTDSELPVFAPLTGMIVVQVTVADSVLRAVERMIGVVLGVAVAVGLGHALGLHVWTISLLVVSGMLAGQVLRLGTQGSVQIAISALLVATVGAQQQGYALDRVADTAIGAVTGLVINMALLPPTHVSPARDSLVDLAHDLSDLLNAVSAGLKAGWSAADAHHWLAEAREISGRMDRARSEVEQAEASLRWNPLRRGVLDEAAAIRQTLTALDRVTVLTRVVSRTLADAITPLDYSGRLRFRRRRRHAEPAEQAPMPIMSRLVADIAAAVGAYPAATWPEAREEDRERLSELLADGERAAEELVLAMEAGRPRPLSTGVMVRGSLLLELSRMLVELDPGHGHGEIDRADRGDGAGEAGRQEPAGPSPLSEPPAPEPPPSSGASGGAAASA
ncbi:MAG: FUSC family protein [Mycobacteriales bacterium]